MQPKDVTVKNWFSTEGGFVPQGALAMSRDMFGYHIWGQGCYWHLVGRSQGAAGHPTVHRTTPITKNYPDQNANSPEFEKSYFKAVLSRK